MIKIFYTMEKIQEIHKEILEGNTEILKDFPLPYCLSENKAELKKVKDIFSNIEIIDFIEKAKEYTVKKLLKLKNDLWLEEDEKEVTKKEFKARMKFTSLYVFSESANFYFDDGDLFWGHIIEVNVNQNLEFTDANIVG